MTQKCPRLSSNDDTRRRTPTIAAINWAERTLIGMGGQAVIFRVAPGLVARIADLDPGELQTQRVLAAHDLALPVLDIARNYDLPVEVARDACPRHGYRSAYMVEPDCECYSKDVLLLPEADDVPDNQPVDDFMDTVLALCAEECHRDWDARPENVMIYNSHFVALDFGLVDEG